MLSALLLASPHLEVAARLGLDAEAGDWDPGRCKQKIQIDSDRYRICGECPLESWNCINLVGSWIKIWPVQHCFFGEATQKDVFSWFYFVWFGLIVIIRQGCPWKPFASFTSLCGSVQIKPTRWASPSLKSWRSKNCWEDNRKQLSGSKPGRAAGQGGRAALLGFVWLCALCALCACARWRSQRIRRPLRQVQLDLRHTVFPCLSMSFRLSYCFKSICPLRRFISFFDILSYPFISFHILSYPFINFIYSTAFGMPPALWPLAWRSKAGVV